MEREDEVTAVELLLAETIRREFTPGMASKLAVVEWTGSEGRVADGIYNFQQEPDQVVINATGAIFKGESARRLRKCGTLYQ